jgi:uncharacterized protein
MKPPIGSPLRSNLFVSAFAAPLLLTAIASQATDAPPAPGCNEVPLSSISGAYRSTDGALISVLPAEQEGHWRITHFATGRSHVLYPVGPLQFQSGADLGPEKPVAYTYHFKLSDQGKPKGLVMAPVGKPAVAAQPVALRERSAAFMSNDTALSGRLTLPPKGKGPFKTVIFVHGSDPVPSVGREWLPHLLAANGIATLVFDKRGTGCSKGQYVQHFGTLSDDVVAAARWLQTQADVDANAIGLAGFSQGGWVAPLAAIKEPNLRFVAVAYGLAMSMADEDRLEAPLKLKEAGLDDEAVAEFKQLNAALHQLARQQFADWNELEQLLTRFQDRPWMAVAAKQQSWVGVFLQMGLPQAKAVAPDMFKNFFQPFYEPVPTLERLDLPMLWLMAGKDIEAPPELTLEALNRLQRQGKPITVKIFPNADHGMQDFVVIDGKRVRTRYAAGYHQALLKWLQRTR